MNLYENGIHSFKKSLDSLIKIDEKDDANKEYILKDIVLSLHHSLEVLFKYMIEKKQKALIYDDLDSFFDSEFTRMANIKPHNIKNEKDIFTISFMQAFKRVIVCYEIKSIDNMTNNCIVTFNKLRNELNHRQIMIKQSEIKPILANVLFNMIPVLERIDEFKRFLDADGIYEKLKRVQYIHDDWCIQRILYLIKCFLDISTRNENLLNYKTALNDFGYDDYYDDEMAYSTEEINTAEQEFILKTFERIFFSKIPSKYKDIEDEHRKSFWIEYHELFLDVTYKTLRGKIEKILIPLLTAASGTITDKQKNIYHLFNDFFCAISDRKKLLIGMELRNCIFIAEKADSTYSSDKGDKKLFNTKLCIRLKKIKQSNNTWYFESNNAEFDFEFDIPLKEYKSAFEKVFRNNEFFLDDDEGFTNYIDDEKEEFILGKIYTDFFSDVCDNVLSSHAGVFGKVGTIDSIYDVLVCSVDAIQIIDSERFYAFCCLEIGTQTYFDHEYYSNGYIYVYERATVEIDPDDGSIAVTEVSLA